MCIIMSEVKERRETYAMETSRMLRFLKKHGFVEISRYTRKGTSHIKLINHQNGRYTEVPMHKGKELKKGIQEGILKQAGLVEEARSE